MELDSVLENAVGTVIIGVRRLVKVQDVDDFLQDLFAEGADVYAFRRGFFILPLIGEGLVTIKTVRTTSQSFWDVVLSSVELFPEFLCWSLLQGTAAIPMRRNLQTGSCKDDTGPV